VDKAAKSQEGDPPRLFLFTDENGKLMEAIVAADGQRVYCQSETVQDALLGLVFTYYAFDLDYPRIYSQFLGFLQEHVFKDTFVGKKSTNFHKFEKLMSQTE
jgi:hypothetical protein